MTLLNARRPIILGPGEGRAIPGPEGLTLKASGDQTNGSIGVLEGTSEPGLVGPTHIHHRSDELFYVLDGEFEFLVGEETVNATAGSFLFIPRGTVHAPKVVGPGPGKVVISLVPGGEERAFLEFAELATSNDGDLDFESEVVQAVVRKYDTEIVSV